MADEAFALSPISARATLPGEEDYEAISQAFMETSRGRWFLGEYARRNRNADTSMVLDAVERIEQTIAAQRQEASDEGLKAALAAIRRAVDEAAAAAAVEGLALEENLAPVRKGARIIKEISWRWREIGADGRICDLLDSQVGAIEAACGQIASGSPHAALSAAFDLIKARIAGLIDAEGADAAVPEPAGAETTEVVTPADATVEAPDVPARAADEKPEDTEAYDEALLDMVALEMGAPDPDDMDDVSDAPVAILEEVHAVAPPPAEPVIAAEMLEPPAQRPAVQAPLQPSLEDSLQPASPDAPHGSPQDSLRSSPEASLGSSLIARGILRKPLPSTSDPLAPIRRMTQAEKIAFFS